MNKLSNSVSANFAPLNYRLLFESAPGLYLVLAPDLKIVAVSDAYLRATMTQRDQVLGRGVFEVFPDNPNDPAATGVRNLTASLDRVLRLRITDTMPVQKYDIRRPESEGGEFEVRYWNPVNSPILAADGSVAYILHHADDVTEFVLLKEREMEHAQLNQRLLTRGEELEAEVFARAREILETNQRLRAANDELSLLHEQLERRVAERTTQLAQANEALQAENLQRRRTEETLRVSEERFRLIVEGVKDYAILMLDTAGTIVSWNAGAERILGYTAGEIIGKAYSQFFPAETADSYLRELEEAAANGHYDAVGWRVRKDGTRFWANGILTALYNGGKQIRGFAKITRDLTEQHRAEEKLKQLAAIVASSDDSIVGITLDGIIESWNPASERIYGYAEREAIGKPFTLLVLPERFAIWLDRLERLANREYIEPVETVRVRKDGRKIEVHARFSPILDNSGNVIGVSAISRDISERKKLESQLQQSQKMEAFGQLAGGVAHDFNNLLTVIGGFSEIVLGELSPGDPNRALVEQIQRAGERASSLTRQLLAFSRQQFLEPKVLDLNDLVRDTEKMLRRLIGEDIILAAALTPALSPVKVDPGQVEQVIMNLAVNARDAMPQGGRLTIETQNVELDSAYTQTHAEVKPGRFVLLAISDTGCGMSPELKARIFEPFFTTKGVGKGTGLGLAVVQGIVKQSGGSIEVYSEVGTGTTFKIYLPAVRERISSPSSPDLSRPVHGTETILLVEDDEAVRDLTGLALVNCGYTLLRATCGKEALALMDRTTAAVDMLVTDVVMPEMSGGKLAEEMRSRYPNIKVLFLSGYTDDAVFRHGILQDQVAFLQKPFTAMSLTRKVREVLDHK